MTDSAIRSPRGAGAPEQSAFPQVACLTCTYGRFQQMRNCLAFFLAQDYPAKHLFVLNNHPVPLVAQPPSAVFPVTIFNEPSADPGIPRNRLLAKVGPEFSFVHTWDDDDAWLPWHLSQAVRQINVQPPGEVFLNAAWKPARSWIHFTGSGEYKLNANNYEASMIVRSGFMRRVGYADASGNEHRPLLDALKAEEALGVTEVGARASYIYTWRGDFSHASASLASDMKIGIDPRLTLDKRDVDWRKLQTDPGDGKTPLTPADIRPRYRDLLAHCRAGLSEYEALELDVLLERYLETTGAGRGARG